MKEIIVSENNKLEIKEVDIPQCSNNDVLVKVAYSGLCGSDIPRIFHHGAHSYPIRLGHEFTGHIVDIGKDVSTVN
ncbi:alcohol dehydrogenase catalytic domain-containing protein, partial [Providencia heimbachae]|uniref:alcohol dehydrogenase catalytic domain-containing protein n=1 Tax=Providencia heimbachae TaxID=333962 RepID=UPI000AC530F5